MIRLYQEKDLEKCRGLWAELTEHHREIYKDQSIGGPEPGLYFDEHLKAAGAGNIYVYEIDGEVVGFYSLLISEEEVQIEPMVVSREYRGKGIGTQLLQHSVGKARELNVHFVSVKPVARNMEAIEFYYRVGFNTLGAVEMLIDLKDTEGAYWKDGLTFGDKKVKY